MDIIYGDFMTFQVSLVNLDRSTPYIVIKSKSLATVPYYLGSQRSLRCTLPDHYLSVSVIVTIRILQRGGSAYI